MSKVSEFLLIFGVLFTIFKITGVLAWGWLAVLSPIALLITIHGIKWAIIVLLVIGAALHKEGLIGGGKVKK